VKRLDLVGGAFVLIWSSGYVVGAIVSEAAAPIAATTWRLGIAALILAAMAGTAGATWPRRLRHVLAILGVGAVLFGVQFGGLYLAMSEGMPAGTAALIMSVCPLVVAALSAVLRIEWLGALQWAGAGLGLLGVVLALADRVARPDSAAPVLWTLLGLAGFALGTLLQRRVARATDVRGVASLECGAAALALVPWAMLHGGLALPMTSHVVTGTAWLTVINAVGGPLALFFLIRTRGATRASSLLFLVPAVTAVASWPVLGQRIGVTTIVGLFVAGAGVRLLTGRCARSAAAARFGSRAHRDRSVREGART
jgi:drug/metabolite transporter (DMT)-like permease